LTESTKLDISLAEMRTLVMAVEAGTFTAAARHLGVTQPAVSRQLIKLEQRLGVALFERDARLLRLTPAGERLLAYAREMLGGFERMLADVNRESRSLKGELRIGASTTLGDFLVPAWAGRFGQLHPEVMPRLFISDTEAVIEDVLDSSVEVGFVGRSPSAASLTQVAVAEDEVVLAVPADHPFARRGEVGLAELQDQPFIVRERASGAVGTVGDTLKQMGLPELRPRSKMAMNSGQASLMAVQKGFGFCWVSIMAFTTGSGAGVVPVRVREARFVRKLYMIHQRRVQKPVAREFMRWLVEEHLAPAGSGSSPPAGQNDSGGRR
jgi:DNA-binding transcriptional LysR family regulator